jgi:hypothetical protein
MIAHQLRAAAGMRLWDSTHLVLNARYSPIEFRERYFIPCRTLCQEVTQSGNSLLRRQFTFLFVKNTFFVSMSCFSEIALSHFNISCKTHVPNYVGSPKLLSRISIYLVKRMCRIMLVLRNCSLAFRSGGAVACWSCCMSQFFRLNR